jgi:hypothetical protein
MTADTLSAALAERVMRWSVCPDRFLLGKRAWLPRWRFMPTENVADAFRLLDTAAPDSYSLGGGDGVYWARVLIAGVAGEARESSQARAIAVAIARAIGIEVERT